MLALQISTDADGRLSRQAIDTATAHILEAVERQGDATLLALIKLRAVREAYDAAIEVLSEKAVEDAERYHKADRSLLGVAFDLSQGGRYEYNDARCDSLESELKQRRKQMQALCQHGLTEGVDDDGEILPAATYVPTRQSLRLTFAK